MKKIMDCFNEAAKIRFFLLQIAFYENFRFQQTVFSPADNADFRRGFFETADCADDADFFLPQMTLISAEDFLKPRIARIARIFNKLRILQIFTDEF